MAETLFRSPRITVDNAEWYVAVEKQHSGNPYRIVRFRPLTDRKERWRTTGQWPGRLPKGIAELLTRRNRRSIEAAL